MLLLLLPQLDLCQFGRVFRDLAQILNGQVSGDSIPQITAVELQPAPKRFRLTVHGRTICDIAIGPAVIQINVAAEPVDSTISPKQPGGDLRCDQPGRFDVDSMQARRKHRHQRADFVCADECLDRRPG